MNQQLILGNQEHEQYLREQVEIYGEHKWSEVARALRIHGIYVDKAFKLSRIWRKLNPKTTFMNANQQRDLIKFGIENHGNYKAYISQWRSVYGPEYKHQNRLATGCIDRIQSIMMRLIKILGTRKLRDKNKFKDVRIQAIRKFLQLGDSVSTDAQVLSVKESSSIMSKLVLACNDNYLTAQPQQYEIYSKLCTRWRFDIIIQHIFWINILHQIYDKSFNTDQKLIATECSFVLPTIEANKATSVYQELFQDIQYLSYYNSAKETLNDNFVYDPQVKAKKVKKHTEIVEVQNKNRKKTVRGRISRNEKKIFQSYTSEKFKDDLLNNMDDDIENDSDILEQRETIINMQYQGKVKKINDQLGKVPTEDQVEREFKQNQEMQIIVQNELKKVKMDAFIKLMNRNQGH